MRFRSLSYGHVCSCYFAVTQSHDGWRSYSTWASSPRRSSLAGTLARSSFYSVGCAKEGSSSWLHSQHIFLPPPLHYGVTRVKGNVFGVLHESSRGCPIRPSAMGPSRSPNIRLNVKFWAANGARRRTASGRPPLLGRGLRQAGMLRIAARRGWMARSIMLVTGAEDAVRPGPVVHEGRLRSNAEIVADSCSRRKSTHDASFCPTH